MTNPQTAPPSDEFDYDVTLSYAREDDRKKYVSKVAAALKQAGLKVHYDVEADSLGEPIQIYLEDMYENRAKYCAIFLSHTYVKKVYPQLELKSALKRAVRECRRYILPGRLDDVRSPWPLRGLIYADLREISEEEFAARITTAVKAKDQPGRLERMAQIAAARKRRKMIQITAATITSVLVFWYVLVHLHSHTTMTVATISAESIQVHLENSGWRRSAAVAYRLKVDGVPIDGRVLPNGERFVELEAIDADKGNESVPALGSVNIHLQPKHEELTPLCRDHAYVQLAEIQNDLRGRHMTLEVDVREFGPGVERSPVQKEVLDASRFHEFIGRWGVRKPPRFC